MPDFNTLIIILVVALVTAFLRFLPFFIFGNKKTPPIIEKLSKILPFAVMGMLCVYCLKDVNFASLSGFIPAIIASLTVIVLHVIKRNTLLSIVSGTVLYMILVQFVF